MRVTVNGVEQALAPGTTVAAVAASVLDRPRGVAVAVNGDVVPKSKWGTTPLAEGDRLEVVTARQGG